MGYVDNNLIPGEEIEDWALIHWVTFVSAGFSLIIGLVVLVLTPAEYEPLRWPVSAAFLLWAIFAGLRSTIIRLTTEVALTNKRIIGKVGLIQRDTIELNLDKVESLFVDQTIMGRILGFGVVRVRGTGGSEFRAYNIAEPLRFKTAAYAAIDRYKSA